MRFRCDRCARRYRVRYCGVERDGLLGVVSDFPRLGCRGDDRTVCLNEAWHGCRDADFYVVVRGCLRGGLCHLCVIGVRLRGVSIVVAVRAMSAVMMRAAARGAVPCRISPAVSFLRLVEYRFSSPRTVYEFPASSVPFRCLVPYSPALYGVMSTWRGCRVRFASVSYHRPVSSRHVWRYASLDKGGRKGYHSIIHMGIGS